MENKELNNQVSTLFSENLLLDAIDLLIDKNVLTGFEHYITSKNYISVSNYLRERGYYVEHFLTSKAGLKILLQSKEHSIHSSSIDHLCESFYLVLQKFTDKNSLSHFPPTILTEPSSIFLLEPNPNFSKPSNFHPETQIDYLVMSFIDNLLILLYKNSENFYPLAVKALYSILNYFPRHVSSFLNINFSFNNRSLESFTNFSPIYKSITLNNPSTTSDPITKSIISILTSIKDNKVIKTEFECFNFVIIQLELNKPFNLFKLTSQGLNQKLVTSLSGPSSLSSVLEVGSVSNSNTIPKNYKFMGNIIMNSLIHYGYQKDDWITPNFNLENLTKEGQPPVSEKVDFLLTELENMVKYEAVNKIISFGVINKNNKKLIPYVLELTGSSKSHIRLAALISASFIDNSEESLLYLLDEEFITWLDDKYCLKLIFLCYRTLNISLAVLPKLIVFTKNLSNLDDKLFCLYSLFKILLFKNCAYPFTGYKIDHINGDISGSSILKELSEILNDLKSSDTIFTIKQKTMLSSCDILISTYNKNDINKIFETFENSHTENILLKIQNMVSLFYMSGNIDIVAHLTNFIGKRKYNENINQEEVDFAVLSLALICGNFEDNNITRKMVIRLIKLINGEDSFASSAIGPAIGLLSLGEVDTDLVALINSLANSNDRLGLKTCVGGILGLGLIGVGSKNSKLNNWLIGILKSAQNPIVSMAVKISQGLVNAGKGLFRLERDESTMKFLAAFVFKVVETPECLIDSDFDTEIWDLFGLLRPKWIVGVNSKGEFKKGILVRVGREIGDIGKKEISGGLVMKLPLIVSGEEKAEFVSEGGSEERNKGVRNGDNINIKGNVVVVE